MLLTMWPLGWKAPSQRISPMSLLFTEMFVRRFVVFIMAVTSWGGSPAGLIRGKLVLYRRQLIPSASDTGEH